MALQRRSSAESVPPRMGAALALAETLLKMDKAPAFGHDPLVANMISGYLRNLKLSTGCYPCYNMLQSFGIINYSYTIVPKSIRMLRLSHWRLPFPNAVHFEAEKHKGYSGAYETIASSMKLLQ